MLKAYHVEGQAPIGIQHLSTENLGETAPSFQGEVMAVLVDLVFATEPIAEFRRYGIEVRLSWRNDGENEPYLRGH